MDRLDGMIWCRVANHRRRFRHHATAPRLLSIRAISHNYFVIVPHLLVSHDLEMGELRLGRGWHTLIKRQAPSPFSFVDKSLYSTYFNYLSSSPIVTVHKYVSWWTGWSIISTYVTLRLDHQILVLFTQMLDARSFRYVTTLSQVRLCLCLPISVSVYM